MIAIIIITLICVGHLLPTITLNNLVTFELTLARFQALPGVISPWTRLGMTLLRLFVVVV